MVTVRDQLPSSRFDQLIPFQEKRVMLPSAQRQPKVQVQPRANAWMLPLKAVMLATRRR